ncbi:MAG: ABC transporter ATP-binding protein [Candidatus Krumholzibacteriota bacterium]|nr:ABC transporter ATP-binding protein [Candidatus Krumholzibacteriota bacterium]
MPNEAIRVDRIEYSYGDIRAVQGISFAVGEGEIFGFLGPNGAGKSTTIKMLTGQLNPQGGKIEVLGMDIARNREKVQALIGICFERTNLYERMSAIENLNLFARLHGVKDFDVTEILVRVGLEQRGRDRVFGLSKGMKQRLMVARALVNRPSVLFLDEPTEGLDPASADNIRNVIRQERDRGATVFLTTHDMLEADKLSDRVAFINDGEIVALDTPDNLKQKFGKRAIRAQVRGEEGKMEEREIEMDRAGTATEVRALFDRDRVITIHSEEASLEDIFIKITGRGLSA